MNFHSHLKPSKLSAMFRYFFWTTLVLLLCGGILGFTLTQLDPVSDLALVVIGIFFTSLFGFICSLMTYLFFFSAELFAGRNLKKYNFRVAIRRGLLVAIFFTGLLGLQMFNMLSWIETLLFAVFLLVTELIFSEN